MYRNRIDLLPYGIESNRKFAISMHKAGLEGKKIKFDFLDCGEALRRQHDIKMGIEKFVSLMDGRLDTAKLQVGSIYSRRPNEINHVLIVSNIPRKKRVVDKFAWLECPYTGKNYEIVSSLFEESFGKRLESIEVPYYLKPYYEQREMECR